MRNGQHIAVITGATSGIGKAFACEYAKRGFDLIITGRRREELAQVADTLTKNYKVKIQIFLGDLGDPDKRKALCLLVQQAGEVDVLINNAGFGIDRAFDENEISEIRAMIGTHVLTTSELTHIVLKGMMTRREGTIINVSSLGAFTPGLTRSMYFATKSYIHYFTEALYMEVHSYGIKVQSLCPGLTLSDFHRNLDNPGLEKKLSVMKFTSPGEVVSESMKTLKKGSLLCIPGTLNKLFYFLSKCIPLRIMMKLAEFRNKPVDVRRTGYICNTGENMQTGIVIPMFGSKIFSDMQRSLNVNQSLKYSSVH